MQKTEPRKSLPAGCDQCCGASHIIGPSGGAQRCDCELGQALAQMERERKHGKRKQAKQAKQRTYPRDYMQSLGYCDWHEVAEDRVKNGDFQTWCTACNRYLFREECGHDRMPEQPTARCRPVEAK